MCVMIRVGVQVAKSFGPCVFCFVAPHMFVQSRHDDTTSQPKSTGGIVTINVRCRDTRTQEQKGRSHGFK